ncbi:MULTISPECIES: HlyC/CorC family transporter [unclassified Agarivorans]|uniref:HlyC/CorC family transporter n=1 Tax=unclassified Agarivorans TaxID=2636026 RepID=UPI0010D31218|nr:MULTISPECIES: CNNM domain-containing protein [unclassified Agarivorans]MDO6687676.1 CNNM domain-containing protein [Agarivorans sp. 3_MG-2023]MDO6717230.1 CNNM domain-containing protein [Agarivorans sp. 2_MG-2023]GDY24397.1 transporter [Agarivorans sp. Toyoura001]
MDDISTSSLLILLVFLIICSAFFSSSETGMMSLNRYRLRHLVNTKHSAASRVDKLLQRPDRLIGLILIGNNLVNILASAIATIIGLRLFGDVGVAIATLALTFVILIFAEVTPKTMAALYPERIAFPASLLLRPLMKLLFPVIWATNGVTNGLLRLLGVNPNSKDDEALNPEELRTVVDEAGTLIPKRHQDMLLSILDLEKVTVDDIMIPRNEIAAIDINDDWDSILRQLTQSTHTRILLFRDSIDDSVGFVHSRDSLRLLSREQFDKTSMLRAAKEIYFIPEGTPLNVQLLKFQRRKERIGLIVDEYGDIQGLVTLEDILEEIVGDFTTSIAPAPSEEIHPQIDGSYLIDGTVNIRDLNKEMSWKLPTDGPKTLNGLIVEHLEDIPEANLCLRLAGYPIEIVEIENNTVSLARVMPAFYAKPKEKTN